MYLHKDDKGLMSGAAFGLPLHKDDKELFEHILR